MIFTIERQGCLLSTNIYSRQQCLKYILKLRTSYFVYNYTNIDYTSHLIQLMHCSYSAEISTTHAQYVPPISNLTVVTAQDIYRAMFTTQIFALIFLSFFVDRLHRVIQLAIDLHVVMCKLASQSRRCNATATDSVIKY